MQHECSGWKLYVSTKSAGSTSMRNILVLNIKLQTRTKLAKSHWLLICLCFACTLSLKFGSVCVRVSIPVHKRENWIRLQSKFGFGFI